MEVRTPSVLLVDDLMTRRNFCEKALQHSGVTVWSHAYPMGVMANLIRRRPDVVVIDAGLPLKASWELLEAIKTHRVLSDTTVLMQMGSRTPTDSRRKLADGVIPRCDSETTYLAHIRLWLAERHNRSSVQHRLHVVFASGNRFQLEAWRIYFQDRFDAFFTDAPSEALLYLNSRRHPDVVVLEPTFADLSMQSFVSSGLRIDPTFASRVLVVGHVESDLPPDCTLLSADTNEPNLEEWINVTARYVKQQRSGVRLRAVRADSGHGSEQASVERKAN